MNGRSPNDVRFSEIHETCHVWSGAFCHVCDHAGLCAAGLRGAQHRNPVCRSDNRCRHCRNLQRRNEAVCALRADRRLGDDREPRAHCLDSRRHPADSVRQSEDWQLRLQARVQPRGNLGHLRNRSRLHRRVYRLRRLSRRGRPRRRPVAGGRYGRASGNSLGRRSRVLRTELGHLH